MIEIHYNFGFPTSGWWWCSFYMKIAVIGWLIALSLGVDNYDMSTYVEIGRYELWEWYVEDGIVMFVHGADKEQVFN
jgi:hypothetical protein